MKYFIFFTLSLPLSALSQKLVENKVDDFTKALVKRTSWETICKKGNFWTYARCSKIDSSRYLTFRIMSNKKVYVVNEGNELMLKLTNDSIVTLHTIKRAISCIGCGSIGLIGSAADGIEVEFFMPKSKFAYLLSHPVAKMRLYSNSGFIEAEIKENWANLLIAQLKLVE